MSEAMPQPFPSTWQLAALEDIAHLIRGVTYKKEEARSSSAPGLVPILRATNITGSSLTFDDLVYVPRTRVSNDQLLVVGDVVVASSSGSKEVVGKAGQLFGTSFSGSFGGFCTAVRPDAELSARFLGYYFQSPSYRKAISDVSAGSNINNIKSSDFAHHLMPVAPRAEQARIVAKLDELLSDLDAGVAELKAAQQKLQRYRQSLLKAAVEGALTAEWRQKNPPTETGAELLRRILRERRARWEEQQLAKFAAQGKAPPKGWKDKYPEPQPPKTEGLPELPNGWAWTTLDQLAELITSGSRGWADYYSKTGATFIRSQDINKDWLDLSDCAYVRPPGGSEGQRTRVELDDLLLTITGANVGKAARAHLDLAEAYVSQHVALLRPVEAWMSQFLHLFLTANGGGRSQLNKAAYGAGKPGLNLDQVGSVVVPLPNTAEAFALVASVTAAMSSVSEQESAIVAALRQSTAQRQNLLRAAFRGELVAQDPNDEPASVLLARLRAERSGTKPAKIERKTRKTKGAA